MKRITRLFNLFGNKTMDRLNRHGPRLVVNRMIVVLVALGALSAIPSSQAAPAFGINLISGGNEYSNVEYNDANLDILFPMLKSKGFRQISIRVIWERAEPTQQGVYNATLLSNLSRIADKAEYHKLDMMLDFHTLFNDGDTWMVPTWLSTIASAGTYNGESVAAVHMKQIFYDVDVRNAYCEMMKHYTWELRNKPAINYISILNEPYLNYGSTINDTTYFEPTVDYLRSQVAFAANGKPIGVRFLVNWNPWCDQANKRIGATKWESLDYVAMNLYPEWGAVNGVYDGTNMVACAHRAIQAVQGVEKKFIISELGYDANFNHGLVATAQQKEEYWGWLFTNVLNPVQCDLVLVWNGENNGSFFPTTTTPGFNIFSAANTLTPYALNGIVPLMGSGGLSANKVYKIKSAITPGLCVDVPWGITGDRLQLWYDNGATPQRWRLLDAGNGYSKLEPLSGPGTRMDNYYGLPDNGNPIITVSDNIYDAQLWSIWAAGNGTHKLINKGSTKALDDPYAAGAAGDQLWQIQDNGNIAQKWIFEVAYGSVVQITNPGFEADGVATGTPQGWTTWSNGNADADYTSTGGRSGTYKLSHWKGTPYKVSTYKVVTGLANGNYSLRAWVQSGGGQNAASVFAQNFDGNATYRSTSIPTAGAWTQITVTNIVVANGQCEIGIWSDANANNWLTVDDVQLIKY